MKKLGIIILIITMFFAFCSKDSTSESEEEGHIILNITVTDNGVPYATKKVEVDIREWVTLSPLAQRGSGSQAYEEENSYDDLSDQYGKVHFTFDNDAVFESCQRDG